jgi:hypothetical protein
LQISINAVKEFQAQFSVLVVYQAINEAGLNIQYSSSIDGWEVKRGRVEHIFPRERGCLSLDRRTPFPYTFSTLPGHVQSTFRTCWCAEGMQTCTSLMNPHMTLGIM